MAIVLPGKVGEVIEIDGVCYIFDAFVNDAVTHTDPDEIFENCSECEVLAGSSTIEEISSSVPAVSSAVEEASSRQTASYSPCDSSDMQEISSAIPEAVSSAQEVISSAEEPVLYTYYRRCNNFPGVTFAPGDTQPSLDVAYIEKGVSQWIPTYDWGTLETEVGSALCFVEDPDGLASSCSEFEPVNKPPSWLWFKDYFPGTSLDLCKWIPSQNNSTITIGSGDATFAVAASGTARILSRLFQLSANPMNGDFQVTVPFDVSSFTVPTSGQGFFEVGMYINGSRRGIRFALDNGYTGGTAILSAGTVGTYAQNVPTTGIFRIRYIRSIDTVYFEWDRGSGWELVGSALGGGYGITGIEIEVQTLPTNTMTVVMPECILAYPEEESSSAEEISSPIPEEISSAQEEISSAAPAEVSSAQEEISSAAPEEVSSAQEESSSSGGIDPLGLYCIHTFWYNTSDCSGTPFTGSYYCWTGATLIANGGDGACYDVGGFYEHIEVLGGPYYGGGTTVGNCGGTDCIPLGQP
jgi:hypothetical protein